MASNRSEPARSAVPPYRAAERGTLDGNRGTEQRNKSGTPDLEGLADKVLSRTHSGTPQRNTSGTPPVEPFRPPRNAAFLPAADYPVCPHVNDVALAYWFAEHPEVVCARCWLGRHR